MIYIIYSKQEDAIPAAAIVYQKISENAKCKAISHPMNQMINFPFEKEDEFWFIGYTFTEETQKFLVKVLQNGNKVTWLDNHRSSMDIHQQVRENTTICRMNSEINLTRSLILMVGEYFQYKDENGHTPLFIDLLDKWEKYIMTTEATRYFHSALVVQDGYDDVSSDLWKKLCSKESSSEITEELINIGRFISIAQKRSEIKALKDICIYKIEDDTECAFLNSTGDRYIFDVAYQMFPMCVLYHFDGTNWCYQVFSKTKNLAGRYALKHGGSKEYRSWTGNFKKSIEDNEIYWFYLNSRKVCSLYDHPKYQEFMKNLDE